MSNYSDFFPGSSGGGGGGNSVQNSQQFNTNGTFDPAANGLAIGSKISVFGIGGGQGGPTSGTRGAEGGYVKMELIILSDTSTITVTIGSGGAAGGSVGGNSSLVQNSSTLFLARGGGSTSAERIFNGGILVSNSFSKDAQGRGYGLFGWGGYMAGDGRLTANGVLIPQASYGQGGRGDARRAQGGNATAGSSGRIVISW